MNNDPVDELAKNAIKLQNIEELPLVFDDIKNKIRKFYDIMKKQMENFHKKQRLCKKIFHIWQFKHKISVWDHQKNAYLSTLCNLRLNMIIFKIFNENGQHEKMKT